MYCVEDLFTLLVKISFEQKTRFFKTGFLFFDKIIRRLNRWNLICRFNRNGCCHSWVERTVIFKGSDGVESEVESLAIT